METLWKPKFPVAFSCQTCKKLYKTRSGLWKHARTCKTNENDNGCIDNDTNKVSQKVVLSLLQQNKDMQELLIEQQKDHYESMHEKQQQINEMIPMIIIVVLWNKIDLSKKSIEIVVVTPIKVIIMTLNNIFLYVI
jgi:hypothetical protein